MHQKMHRELYMIVREFYTHHVALTSKVVQSSKVQGPKLHRLLLIFFPILVVFLIMGFVDLRFQFGCSAL